MKDVKNRFYEFGEFRIDARERLLSRDGKLIPINFKSFDVLLVLIQNEGQLLEKEELMRQVWAEAIVEEANLKNCVSALRKALGDTPNQSRYIQTLPKLGYKFVAPVVILPDEKADLIVERHTLTEVLIERESVTFSEDEIPAETILNGHSILPDTVTRISDAEPFELKLEKLIVDTQAVSANTQPLPEVSESKNRFSRKPIYKNLFAIATAVLLLAFGGLFLFKSLFAAKAKSAFAFDKIKMTRLTDIGNIFTVISTDGKYLAYCSGDQSGASLSVKQVDSNQVTELLPKGKRSVGGISFSHDNERLYCTITDKENPAGAIYEIPLSGETPRKLFQGIDTKASLSPDGKRLVFRRSDNAMGRNMIVVANLDGSDEQILIPASLRYSFFDCLWSPDGKTITLILRLFDENGNRFWQVAEIPATGGAIKSITEPQKESIISLSWMPDESGMVIVAREPDKDLKQLWFVSYPDGHREKITNDINDYNYVLVTDAGKSIFATHISFTSTLWVASSIDPAGAQKLNLASGYYNQLYWTPDNRILYSHAGDIWSMSSDGSNRQRLTADAGLNSCPIISSDSRYIAFLSNRSGRIQVWRADSDGSHARQITSVPNDVSTVQFGPDGKWLFYATWFPVGWTIWKIPVDGGTAVQLTFKDTQSSSISPDGKELAYTVYDERKKRDLIAFKSTEGGEPNKFYEFPALESYNILQWEKDGLFCTNKAGTELFLLPITGGKPKQLTHFNSGEALDASISPDGTKLTFARINANKDILLIAGFK
jgi:Tol biopolymer transport system component/DNA-binding winged helix-turn-helix (wHTH) protein